MSSIRMGRRSRMILAGSIALVMFGARGAEGAGAILHKSGPLQITEDGAYVWAALQDHDAVARLEVDTGSVTFVAMPAEGAPHQPRGVAITEDGSEVWVACHDSGRVFVLDAATTNVLATLVLHPGSGPIAVGLAPDGLTAWVVLHRENAVAVFDAATYEQLEIISGLFLHPFGIAFDEAGTEAWVSHTLTDGEDSYISRYDVAARTQTALVVLKSVNPKEPDQIAGDPDPIPEGGYLLPRGPIAMRPDTSELWLPVQYMNFHNPEFTSDSCVQAAIHKLDLESGTQIASGRVVLSAVYAHDNTTLLGDGWNAGIGGPIDLAFDAEGTTAYLVNTYSNDLLVFSTGIGKARPAGAAALVEIPVGDHPVGVAISPVAETAYVLNHLSRDLSVIDLVAEEVSEVIPLADAVSEPMAADILAGAKLFNSSADPRLSVNGKVACASCHVEEGGDGLMWSFAQFGAGNRKTLNLRGLAHSFGPPAGGLGQLHRSGDRDEVQDFDLTARGALMGGSGFLASPNPALGAPNAGLDADLDALAAYVLGIPAIARSPARDADGELTEEAVRGALVFQGDGGSAAGAGCNACHTAPSFTDLTFHDVNSFATGTEFEGPEFNTPSLVGAWDLPPYVQVVGWGDGSTIGGVLRGATAGYHGDTSALAGAQMRDLEAFVKSIDGALAASGIGALADTVPPRVVAVRPVSLGAVEVIFSETVDAASAGDAANYQFTDGAQTIAATAAVVDAAAGNRVRVAVPLDYAGCPVVYTLASGPIEDISASYGAAANNVLDAADPANALSFEIDGTITVTFGSLGTETFPSVARDASFAAGLSDVSFAHMLLYPTTTPEIKGFVAFDFAEILAGDCGVADSGDILEASFSAQPQLGHLTTLQLRRCLMPWGEPPNDWCFGCTGAVTRSHATYPTIAWHSSGAASRGGSGTDASEYYPSAEFDTALTVDLTIDVPSMNGRMEFTGGEVTEAFRFWFDHPEANNGYCIEVSGNPGVGTEFAGADFDAGSRGIVLAITFAVAPNAAPADCDGTPDDFVRGDVNDDGALDIADVVRLANYLFAGGLALGCADAADVDDDGALGIADAIFLLTYLFLEGAPPAAPFPICGGDPGPGSFGCVFSAECP